MDSREMKVEAMTNNKWFSFGFSTLAIIVLALVLGSSCGQNFVAPNLHLVLNKDNMIVPENNKSDMELVDLQYVASSLAPANGSNPNAGISPKTYSFELVSTNGPFKIENDKLIVVNKSFNYEVDPTQYEIKVAIKSSDAHRDEKTFGVEITNVNESPFDILLSGTSLKRNATDGAKIGNLTAKDYDLPKTAQIFTYSILSQIVKNTGAAVSFFKINKDSLIKSGVIASALFSKTDKVMIDLKLRVTDQGGLFYDKTFTVTISESNTAPDVIYEGANVIADTESVNKLIGQFKPVDKEDNATVKLINITYWDGYSNQLFKTDRAGDNKSLDFKLQQKFDYKVVEAHYFAHASNAKAAPTLYVTVQADDGEFKTEKTFEFSLAGSNHAPTIEFTKPIDDMWGWYSDVEEVAFTPNFSPSTNTSFSIESGYPTRGDNSVYGFVRVLDADNDTLTVRFLPEENCNDIHLFFNYMTGQYDKNPDGSLKTAPLRCFFPSAHQEYFDTLSVVSTRTEVNPATGVAYSALDIPINSSDLPSRCYQTGTPIGMVVEVSDGKTTVRKTFNMTVVLDGSITHSETKCKSDF